MSAYCVGFCKLLDVSVLQFPYVKIQILIVKKNKWDNTEHLAQFLVHNQHM